MKKWSVLMALPLLLATMLLAGCGRNEEKKAETKTPPPTSQEVKKEIGDAVQTTTAYTQEQWDKFSADAKTRLDAMAREIDALDKKADAKADQAKVKAKQSVADLKTRQKAAAIKLEELKAAGRNAAKDVKTSFDALMDQLAKEYEAVKKDIG